MPERRVQRQTLIDGWNQDKIDESFLFNIGSGLSPRYATLLASCLEFGGTLLFTKERGYKREKFMGVPIRRGNVAQQIECIVKTLNDNANLSGFSAPIQSEIAHLNDWVLPILFHSGNDWKEKRYILANLVKRQDTVERVRGESQKQSIVLSAANHYELRLADYDIHDRITPEHMMPQFRHERPSTITAIASAAMGLGEAVRRKLGLGESLDEILIWNLHSRKRTSHLEDFDWSKFDPRGKKIGVIGIGAVGLMYLEATHDIEFERFYLVDFDRWGLTNFSRAPQCAGEIGRLKAHAAARHFNKRGISKYTGINKRLDEKSDIPKVDLLISAVDGFDNQMRVINYSQQHQTPLLLGGCTPYSCVVYAYVPGKTSSMLYQYDFLKQAYLDSVRQEHPHCTDPVVQGSQVLITALCASVLAGETINLFCGEPLTGQFRYDMLHNPRIDCLQTTDIRDLGKNVPDFIPLPKSRVRREIKNGVENIFVDGKPFDEWYDQEGNILNR